MKINHMIALLQTGYTTIKVQLGGPTGSLYTYKAPLGLIEGDQVVVEMPGGHMRVLDVVKVDETPQIDVDSDIDYKWVVQKVDKTQYNELLAKEEEAKQLIIQQEMAKKRKELVEEHLGALAPKKRKELEFLVTVGH